MSRFKPSVAITDNQDGTHTVDYTLFNPGANLSQDSVSKTQITDFNSSNKDVPGVQISVIMSEASTGNPLTFQGSFTIESTYELNSNKPFIDIRFKMVNPSTQVLEVVDGHISRKHT